jgi:RING finger and CHY zinc finger domain-containing protein 1
MNFTNQIRNIMKDNNLSHDEKLSKIKELQKNISNNFIKNNYSHIICTHYDRNCLIISKCCNKVYQCRFCHDDNEDHKINRFSTEKIICKKCNIEQGISNKCINCNIEFGKYYCYICRLWFNDDKEAYHCEKCGNCRAGKKEEYIHCDKCNMCQNKDIYESHKCFYNSFELDCPICNDNLKNSIKPVVSLKCGHGIHQECLRKNITSGNLNCPLCKMSVSDMNLVWNDLDDQIRLQPMPLQYRGYSANILCNDCLKTSINKYHFLGVKCKECGSYNTQMNELIKPNNTDNDLRQFVLNMRRMELQQELEDNSTDSSESEEDFIEDNDVSSPYNRDESEEDEEEEERFNYDSD